MARAKKMGPHKIIVVRAQKKSRFHDDVPPPVAPEHEISGCSILPRLASGAQASNEENKGWTIVEGNMIIAPYGSDVLATDEIRLPDGTTVSVDGKPGVYENKRGRGKGVIFYTTHLGTA